MAGNMIVRCLIFFFLTPLLVLAKEDYADLRDPTRPLNYSQSVHVEETPVVLMGIVFRGNSSIAIINGKVVREKDRLDDIHITRIERYSVTYRQKGSSHTLYLRSKLIHSGVR